MKRSINPLEGPDTSQSYDPNTLEISKAEVLEFLNLVYIRLKNNPKVSKKIKTKLWSDIKLVEYFATEQELKYNVALFLEITDGFRSIIERKKRPELQRLNELHKDAMIKRIVMPPEVHSELEAKKILLEVKKSLGYGGMTDG